MIMMIMLIIMIMILIVIMCMSSIIIIIISIVLEAPTPKHSFGDKTSLYEINTYSDKQQTFARDWLAEARSCARSTY